MDNEHFPLAGASQPTRSFCSAAGPHPSDSALWCSQQLQAVLFSLVIQGWVPDTVGQALADQHADLFYPVAIGHSLRSLDYSEHL